METYTGRIECDGYGNLLASEGERAGMPIFHDVDAGDYKFVEPGGPSHNERHHKQFVSMDGTVDESMTADKSLVNADADRNPHHFETQSDDPHYDESMPNKTRMRFDADALAAKITGHTDAYTGGAA